MGGGGGLPVKSPKAIPVSPFNISFVYVPRLYI